MSSKHYNELEFKKIIALIETDPVEAKAKIEEYIEKHPLDYIAYPQYASILIANNNFEEAESILNFAEETLMYKTMSPSRKKQLQKNIVISKLKFLSYTEQYFELYKLCKQNYEFIKDFKLIPLYLLTLKKLRIPIKWNISEDSYLLSLIQEYTDEKFLLHIRKHLDEYNINSIEPNDYVFSNDFPLELIFNEIKKYIPSEKKILPGFYENVYIFKYDECGRSNRKITNYFKVVCFHNTTDFITMVPTSKSGNLPFVDLNYLKEPKEVSKIKKISQIDKFNKRYNIK